MIKAVIFDCFGVLTTEGWQEFKQTYFSNSSKLEKANKLNKLADQGKINHEQLLPLIAELAEVSTSQARKEIDNYQPNKKLLNYISVHLRSEYKIGMLSNVSDDWILKLFSPEQVELFDEIALSFNIGYIKPERQAYEFIAAKLKVMTDECVFIDDRQHFVDAAKAIGMQGVQYKNYEQTIKDLEAILKVTDTNK